MKKTSKKKARRRLVITLTTLLIVVGIILSVFVFFKIETIEVRGVTRYSQKEITSAAGLEAGGNLFGFLSFVREERLCRELPYIQSAVIKRYIPNKILIEVTEVTVAGAYPVGNDYYIVSSAGKLLEKKESSEGYAVVLGVDLTEKTGSVGLAVDWGDDEHAEATAIMEEAYKLNILDKLSVIDVSDKLEITVIYDGRIKAILGTGASVAHKLEMLFEVAEHREAKEFVGRIDLSKAGEAIVSDDFGAVDEYAKYIKAQYNEKSGIN